MTKSVKTEKPQPFYSSAPNGAAGKRRLQSNRGGLLGHGSQVFILDLPRTHFKQTTPTSSGYLDDRLPSRWLRLSQHKGSHCQDTEAPKWAWQNYLPSTRQRGPLECTEVQTQQFVQGLYAAVYMWSSFYMYCSFVLLEAGWLHRQLTFSFTCFYTRYHIQGGIISFFFPLN